MIARVHSFVLQGIDAVACEIEAHLNVSGMPKTTIVGLPDTAVKEAAERVRAALGNCGYSWPQQRLTINLAPADLRKEGPVYDLPVAIAILVAQCTIRPSSERASSSTGISAGPDRSPRAETIAHVVNAVESATASMPSAAGAHQAPGARVGPAREDASATTAPSPEARLVVGAEADVPCGARRTPALTKERGGGGRAASTAGQDSRGRPDVERSDPTGPAHQSRSPAGVESREPARSELVALDDFLLAGELALDGRLRPIRGAIGLALLARQQRRRGVILPAANAREAAVVDGIEVREAHHLSEVVRFLNNTSPLAVTPPVNVDELLSQASAEIDFAEVRGQEGVKRALTIAASGGHNILLIGPAGTGKTMMARALPGILPPLTREEALEVTRIHSSVGALPRHAALVARRPVRSPHHTASTAAIVGGGPVPRPGEVSLAHRGILFLDELPEFARPVLEAMREPLEDGHVTIARASGSVRFPARVMLVAAMNPTHRGDGRIDELMRAGIGDGYLARLSGPLIDRIDIHVEVPAVPFRMLASTRRGTDTATMRARVLSARRRMQARNDDTPNAELSGRRLDRFAPMDAAARAVLDEAMTALGLSARAYDRIRRVARTIADLDDADTLAVSHVAEAVQYRLLDRRR